MDHPDDLVPERVQTPRGLALRIYEIAEAEVADTHRAAATEALRDMLQMLGAEAVPPDGIHWFTARPRVGAQMRLLLASDGVNGGHPDLPREIGPGRRSVPLQTGFNDGDNRIWVLEPRGWPARHIGETVAHEAFHRQRTILGMVHTEDEALAFGRNYARQKWPPWYPSY